MNIRPFQPEFAPFLHDESRWSGTARAVAFPETEVDVQEAVAWARANHTPITLQGAKTGITGAGVPDGGLLISFARMNRILEFLPATNALPARIRVQPGLPLQTLREALPDACRKQAHPLQFFPPDPTETSASIGGMIACNASGALSFRYGSTRQHIHALKLLTSEGHTLHLRRGEYMADGFHFHLPPFEGELPRLPILQTKNATGYNVHPGMDLLDLFVGGEGTLAVITEAELYLHPVPAYTQALAVWIPTGDDALVQLVAALRSIPLLAALEYFDEHCLAMLKQHPDFLANQHIPILPSSAETCLYLEWHADTEEEAEQVFHRVETIFAAAQIDIQQAIFADSPTEIQTLKHLRHAVPELVNLLLDQRKKEQPHIHKISTDFAVPPEHLADLLHMYRASLKESQLEYVLFGHIGDQHLHLNILPRGDGDMECGRKLCREWAGRAVAWGGTVSAEHGTGKLKRHLLPLMLNADMLRQMNELRKIFDPQHLLNPENLSPLENPIP